MSTPVVTGFVFTNKDSPETDKEKIEIKDMQVLYQKLVGKLGYIVTWGRPDLALARSKLGKFAKNPDSKHMVALKRVLRYLRGTMDLGIVFQAVEDKNFRVEGYFVLVMLMTLTCVERPWATSLCYVGGPISWERKLHPAMATSTNNAEYQPYRATREAVAIKMLFIELGFSQVVSPLHLFSDSAGAIAIISNPGLRNLDHYT